MMDDDRQIRRTGASGRIWAGLFLLLVGGVLLLDQMGFPLPDWLFSWHVLLIAIGLFIGLRHNFRGGAWFILIVIGGAFMIQDYYPDMQLHRFIWPGVLIVLGLLFILRPRSHWNDRWDENWKHEWKERWREQKEQKWRRHHWHKFGPYPPQDPNNPINPGGPNPSSPNSGGPNSSAPNPGQPNPGSPNQAPPNPNQPTPNQPGQDQPSPGKPDDSRSSYAGGAYSYGAGSSGYSSEDFIDTTSVFGGVHKKVVSKNFKGGDITTFLGGTEIDLTQADFNGVARLDVTQVMGGTKIIVPAHWEVRSEITAIFAGFEDKRQQPAALNPQKVLILEGTSIFGGIELKNY